MKKKFLFAPLCGLLASGLLTLAPRSVPAAPPAATSPAMQPRTTPSTPASTNVPSVAINKGGVAAEVGGDKIMMDDVNRLVDGLVESQPKLADKTPEAQKALKELRNSIVENMISQQLLYQEAQRLKLSPTEEQINDAVWKYQKALDLSDPAFQKWLAEEGKTKNDIRALLTKRLSADMLKRKLVAEILVSDGELNAFYTEHQKDFIIPELVNARHIQISFPRERDKDGKSVESAMTNAEKKKLQQKAQAILKKATAPGADFAALAKESSDDGISKGRGGVIDVIYPDGSVRPLTRDDKELVDPAFFEALFNAPIGKVYPQLVESKLGFHIIKVEKRTPSRTLPLSEVTKYIRPQILQKKAKERIDQQLAVLRAKANVKKSKDFI